MRIQKIYHFNEGSLEDKGLLSNKGAHICEITRLGLPVPTGFILSTVSLSLYCAN